MDEKTGKPMEGDPVFYEGAVEGGWEVRSISRGGSLLLDGLVFPDLEKVFRRFFF